MAATKSWYATITKFENFSQGVPASDESIAKAERSLGVVFPREYVDFLKKFGFAGWFGHAINGIIDHADDELAEFFDVVTNTQDALKRKLPKNYQPVPEKSIVLEEYDAGGLYLLCCDEADYGKVLLITDGSKYDVEREWSDFDEFARDHLLEQ